MRTSSLFSKSFGLMLLLSLALVGCDGMGGNNEGGGNSGGGNTGGGNSGGGNSGGGTTQATITVNNQSNQTIFYLYISPCSDTNWGPDRLGTSVLMNGTQRTFSVSAGCYDLRVETQSGSEAERFGVNITGSFTWTITPGAAHPIDPAADRQAGLKRQHTS